MYYFELKADHGVEGMKTLVVGLFDSERLALEASGLLYSSGLSKLDMVVISRDSSRHDAEYVRGYSPSSMVMRQAFK